MKIHLIYIIFGLLVPIFTYSQEQNRSYIYNYKGQLRVDTSLTITQKQYKAWSIAEDNLLSHLSRHINYPPLANESGIIGIVIISFDCDTLGIKNIRAMNKIGGGLDKAAIEGITRLKEKILLEFRHTQNIKRRKPISYQGTYYIPIDFTLINLLEYKNKNYTIPILDGQTVGISRWIE